MTARLETVSGRHIPDRLLIACWFVLVLLLFLLTGCGGEEPPVEATGVEAEAEHSEGHGATEEMASGEVMVDPRKQMLIGVTYGVVERKDVAQTIRAVGLVSYDESRLVEVNLKFHGWVETLDVNETGALVRRGQTLLTLYSPELVATQEEYLSAFDHSLRLQDSGHPEATEGAQRLLEAARLRLSYWDIEKIHLEDLEKERKVLRAVPIHSPASGYVIEKNVLQGSHVPAGHMLYRLANLDRVWILADIYEYELPLVSLGQPARVSLAYSPETKLEGRVTYIYPYLEAGERTVKVRVELSNPGHQLKEGMYADVQLDARRAGVLVVPTSAVLDSGTRQVVFVGGEDGRFEPRQVTLGARFEDELEVLSGLELGERIVTSGNFLLDSESQLTSGLKQMEH